jgi:hypothetical protein
MQTKTQLFPVVLLSTALLCQLLIAQDSSAAPEEEYLTPAVAEERLDAPAPLTFIPSPLVVKPFTPPVPVVRKPPPPVRIHTSVTTRSSNGRTLTLQRGEASNQPDLPPPPPPPPYIEPHEPTPEEIAHRIWYQRHNLHLGATIYDHKISVINWTDQETLVHYEAVCGFDVGLLAGIGGFVHNGENYSLLLMHSHIDTVLLRRLASEYDFAAEWLLEIPDIPTGEIQITRGDAEDEIATAPITILKDIIAAETPRLLDYQFNRAVYHKASAAWHAAHPPLPRDQTFIFRPHRGSRYLPRTESDAP